MQFNEEKERKKNKFLLSISLSSVKKFCHYDKLSSLEVRMTLKDTKFSKEEVMEQPE